MSERTEHATWAFDLHWSNDQDLYNAVLAYARELLKRQPNMTDQTLGRNVIDRVAAWCGDGGYGYPSGQRAPGVRSEILRMMADEVNFRDVDEIEVGQTVRESLGIETPTPGEAARMIADVMLASFSDDEDDHDPRPDDDPEPGDRCKICGRPITWIGPSTITDWEHVEDDEAQS